MHINFLNKVIFIVFFSFLTLQASIINVVDKDKVSLLEYSDIYVDSQDLTIEQVIKKDKFTENNKAYLNFGVSNDTIWVRLSLENKQNIPLERLLVFNTALLEHIAIYDVYNISHPIFKGTKYVDENHRTLNPVHKITLFPNEKKDFIIEFKSRLTVLKFGLSLLKENYFYESDIKSQLIDILLLGMVLAFTIFSFLTFFYSKDKRFLYYGVFLLTLIYWQITFLGVTQIYFPKGFIAFDNLLVVVKANLNIIASSVFSMSFLQTYKIRYLHRIYQFFIIFSLINIIFFSYQPHYRLDITLVIGMIYIFFNLIAAFIAYKKGNKQARLYVVGTGMLVLSYCLIILDSAGFISVVYQYPNLLLWGIVLEAVFISLAFVDRYNLVQQEKTIISNQLLEESKNRESIIQHDVNQKTKQLKQAMNEKELLFKELHHRVKNNLQLILSITNLQLNNLDINTRDVFKKWENRIRAIAKTHEIIYLDENIEMIDMSIYIEELVQNLEESNVHDDVHIQYDINLELPLREAVYVGLIINELVSNSFKYAFGTSGGQIKIMMDKSYILICDNGEGYNYADNDIKNLGLQLVKILVEEQLQGCLKVNNSDGLCYEIWFRE